MAETTQAPCWSRRKPTKDGYYWYRHAPDRLAEIVWVGSEAGEQPAVVSDLENCWRGMPVIELSGQWAGPIPGPTN